MDTQAFLKLLREAEAKLARGMDLSRGEQVILLAGLLLGQSTRKEKRYGQG